jgi:hypothetical protein
MAKQYDKILKENIEQVFLPLSEKYLGIKILEVRDLPEKLQITLEREPDFIKIVRTDKQETFILHMEFQTHDESGMVYRMAEYNAIMMRKFGMPVRQFVIYLGVKRPKMRTELAEDEIIKGFGLVNIHELDTEHILDSDVPEEIMLAILGDYHRTKADMVIRKIIGRLRELCSDEIRLQKYIQQLIMLSRLRNLEVETKKEVEHMPITYDIKKDGLFLEGMKIGEKLGEKQGEKRGVLLVAERLLKKGMPIQEVSEICSVPKEELEEILKNIRRGKSG